MGEAIRVVHIDDDVDFLELSQASLQRVDDRLAVETVTTPEALFDQLEANTVECIVADYDMPTATGVELLREVRTHYGDLPFILFTGKGGEEVASEAIANGVTDYLQKRVSTDQFELLVNRIVNAVDRYRAERALAEHVRQLETLISNLPGIAYRSGAEYPWPMQAIRGDCEELTGYESDELVEDATRYSRDIIHPDDRDRVMNEITDGIDATGSFEVRYRIVTADGVTKWVYESGQLVTDTPDGLAMLEGFINDITGWYHHRERQRVLFEDAADAIAEVEFEGDTALIDRVNPAFERIFGVSAFEAEGRPINEVIVPPEGRDRAADIDRRVQEGELVEEELLRRTASDIRWFLLRTVPFTLGNDQRAYATYVDITDQKDRESAIEALHEAARSMFNLVDESDIYAITVDAASEVLGLSSVDIYELAPSRQSLTVVATTDPAGPTARPAVTEADGPIWRAYEDGSSTVVTEPVDALDRLHQGDGAAASALVVPIGDRGLLVSTATDVDRFDQAALRLADLLASATGSALEAARRESQLTELHNAATVIGATDSEDEVFEELIVAAEEILEFDFAVADVVEGDHLVTRATSSAIEDASFFERTPIEAEDNVAATSFREGAPDLTPDLRDLDVTPADPDFLSALTVPIGEHGVIQAAAKQADAFSETDLEFAELLVSHANEALTRLERTHELEERTAELNRQNDRLEQFAGIVSHDLRNPLNVIAGRLELAREDSTGEHLDAIEDAVERMEAIIEDTLRLARQGRTVGVTETIELESLANGCWTRVATGDASFSVEDSMQFEGDPERVQHVLENLFRNAIEHATGAVQVRVGPIDNDGFYVADDGPGIPSSSRTQVFEPGYTTGTDGIGIGLPIVADIVEAHGWEIRITDSWAGGARFEITGLDGDT